MTNRRGWIVAAAALLSLTSSRSTDANSYFFHHVVASVEPGKTRCRADNRCDVSLRVVEKQPLMTRPAADLDQLDVHVDAPILDLRFEKRGRTQARIALDTVGPGDRFVFVWGDANIGWTFALTRPGSAPEGEAIFPECGPAPWSSEHYRACRGKLQSTRRDAVIRARLIGPGKSQGAYQQAALVTGASTTTGLRLPSSELGMVVGKGATFHTPGGKTLHYSPANATRAAGERIEIRGTFLAPTVDADGPAWLPRCNDHSCQPLFVASHMRVLP